MATEPYKILLFMKRRPGMSLEAFQDYYENHHAPLCAKYASGVSRYIRRFLTPHPNPETGEKGELPYDVITELWFEDEAAFRGREAAVRPSEAEDGHGRRARVGAVGLREAQAVSTRSREMRSVLIFQRPPVFA